MPFSIARTAILIAGTLFMMHPGLAQSFREHLIRQNQKWLSTYSGPGGSTVINMPRTGKPQRSAAFSMREKPGHGDLSSMGVTVKWSYGRKADPDDLLPLTVEIQESGKTVLTKKFDDGVAMFGAVQIARLDASTKSPQVLVLTNGGGTVNVSSLDIATSSVDGKWRWIKTECCSGDPEDRLVRENVPGEDVGMIIDLQTVYLDRFSNAARWGTISYQIFRIDRGKLVDVSMDMEFQAVHKRRLAEWFSENDQFLKGGRRPVSDEQWTAASIGYLAIKARLGEFPEAWNTFITDFGFGRDRKLQAEVKSALVQTKIITAAMVPASLQAPSAGISVKVTDTMMDGGIKEIDLTLSEQGKRRTIRGVLVNCNPGFPQITIGQRRWTVNSDTGTVQEGARGFPAGEVWKATCR